MIMQSLRYIVVFFLLIGVFSTGLRADDKDNKTTSNTSNLNGPIFKLESTIFELGIIPEEEKQIVGLVPFINRGKQTLEITKVDLPELKEKE